MKNFSICFSEDSLYEPDLVFGFWFLFPNVCAFVCTNMVLVVVPFEEDPKSPTVWFMDHDYLVNMYHMFRKVSGRFSTSNGFFLCTVIYFKLYYILYCLFLSLLCFSFPNLLQIYFSVYIYYLYAYTIGIVIRDSSIHLVEIYYIAHTFSLNVFHCHCHVSFLIICITWDWGAHHSHC